MHAHCSATATSMPAIATAIEAAVLRDAPGMVSSDWQVPGLGTLQAESKAGSVMSTLGTPMAPLILRYWNKLRGKNSAQKGKKKKKNGD